MEKYDVVFVLPYISVIVVSIIVIFIPNAVNLFSFSGKNFFSGELWRLITFLFTHVNLTHLAENIIGIIAILLLAYALNLEPRYFVYCFLLASMLIAIIWGILMPIIFITGASLGIYSMFGSLSIKSSNLIPKYVLIPIIIISIFTELFLNGFQELLLIESSLHFSGFISGMGFFYISALVTKKKRVLTQNGKSQNWY